MKVTVLGSGTSSGVPTIGCTCATCLSDDPRDKRLRPSILLETATTRVVIDTASDFRQQMLQYRIPALDAVVYTHHHFDHIAGFDDIRAYNFLQKQAIPIYLLESTFATLRRMFAYAFEELEQTGGGVPLVTPCIIGEEKFVIGDIPFLPIPLYHGNLRINGYRIGNFAYCTDTNLIPETSFPLLEGIDILILDALRYHKHPTHFTVEEAIVVAKRIGAHTTYFTHIAHNIRHAELEPYLPADIFLAYDGLELCCSV